MNKLTTSILFFCSVLYDISIVNSLFLAIAISSGIKPDYIPMIGLLLFITYNIYGFFGLIYMVCFIKIIGALVFGYLSGVPFDTFRDSIMHLPLISQANVLFENVKNSTNSFITRMNRVPCISAVLRNVRFIYDYLSRLFNIVFNFVHIYIYNLLQKLGTNVYERTKNIKLMNIIYTGYDKTSNMLGMYRMFKNFTKNAEDEKNSTQTDTADISTLLSLLSSEIPMKNPLLEQMPVQISEPVTEPVPVPVSASVSEPVTEPVSEPVTEQVTEPVSEPVTEQVTEPVSEPVTEPSYLFEDANRRAYKKIPDTIETDLLDEDNVIFSIPSINERNKTTKKVKDTEEMFSEIADIEKTFKSMSPEQLKQMENMTEMLLKNMGGTGIMNMFQNMQKTFDLPKKRN